MAREFFPNFDFDVSQTGRSILTMPGAPQTHLHELGLHYLLAGDTGDSLLAYHGVPEGFLEYLNRLELPHARPFPVTQPNLASSFTPFGWNRHAFTLNQAYYQPSLHPELETVTRVNSRTFGAAVEQAYAQTPYGMVFRKWNELQSFIKALVPGPWVAKGDFGNAGLANWFFSAPPLAPQDETVLRRILEQTGGILVEPRHQRLRDFGITFQLTPEGEMRDYGVHELLNNSLGVFIGCAIFPELQLGDEVQELRLAASFAATALHQEGYFGPVNLDAYQFQIQEEDSVRNPVTSQEENPPSLRPLVDINARNSMTLPARRLAQYLNHRYSNRYLRWEWRASKRFHPPKDYQDFAIKLSNLAYTPETGVGILAASPLWLTKDGKATLPKRISIAFISDSEKGIQDLRSEFDRMFKLHRGKSSNS